MALLVGQTYPAKVTGGKFISSGKKETPGVEVYFNCGEHGSIASTLYVTPGGIEITRKALNALGVTDEQLESDEFYDDIGKWVTGAECSIVIGEDEYEGKKKLIVKFINSGQRSGTHDQARAAAGLFRMTNPAHVNGKYSSRTQSGPPPTSDEYVPSDEEAAAAGGGRKRY